jgi:DNA modification methylase
MTHRTNSSRTTRRPIAPPPPKATEQLTPGQVAGALPPRGLAEKIARRAVNDLKPFPGNPRRHPEAQLARLMNSIAKIWTNPILIDESDTILAGHARLEAAKRLGLTEVPTLTIVGLTAAEKRAVVISDNRLPEQAVWDFDLLRDHFKALIDIDFDVELTGFSTGEIDLLLDGKPVPAATDPADDVTGLSTAGPAISQPRDVWELDRHRLVCGDGLQSTTYEILLRGKPAEMVATDPPYNVLIDGHAMGRGRVRHREFKMASGEMSEAAFTTFLETFICQAIGFSEDGSIHYVFIDWRHLPELLSAARPRYAEWKNLLVWNKANAGQGSFYRNKHELIAVFKNGTAPHINNFGLGAQGRYRANVLDYPGVNCLHPARRGELDLHPTVKPLALIADLIRDCSRRNGLILDPFAGSGTTILAAERTGRIARAIELDPLYVDVAIRRWEQATGIPARHAELGLTFAEIAAKRGIDPGSSDEPCSAEPAGRRSARDGGRIRDRVSSAAQDDTVQARTIGQPKRPPEGQRQSRNRPGGRAQRADHRARGRPGTASHQTARVDQVADGACLARRCARHHRAARALCPGHLRAQRGRERAARRGRALNPAPLRPPDRQVSRHKGPEK